MAELGHVFGTPQTTAQVVTATAYQAVLTTSGLTGSKNYLYLCSAQLSSLIASSLSFRVRRGTTTLAGSEINIKTIGGNHNTYFYFVKDTQPATPEAVTLELHSSASGLSVEADTLDFVALDLDDTAFASGTDWAYTDEAVSTSTTTSWQIMNSLVVTPAATEAWLIMASFTFSHSTPFVNHLAGITIDATDMSPTYQVFSQEGEITNEISTFTMMFVRSLSSGSTHNIRLKIRNDGWTGATTHKSSRIMAIRLGAFDSSASADASSTLSLATYPSTTTVGSVSVTPPVGGGDVLLLGSIRGMTTFENRSYYSHLEMAGVETPSGGSANTALIVRDFSDTAYMTKMAHANMTAGAKTLSAEAAGSVPMLVTQRMLAGFTMELASGAPPANIVPPAAATIPIVAPAVTVAPGERKVSPSASAIPLAAPAVTIKRPRTVSVGAASIAVAAPNPTVTAGERKVTPAPATVPIAAPGVTYVQSTTQPRTVTPAPATISIAAPAVTVTRGTRTVQPSAATVPIAAPAPRVNLTLMPSPATIPIAAPNPAKIARARIIAPSSVAININAPGVTIDQIGAESTAFFLGIVTLNPSWYPSTATFVFEAIFAPDSAANTAVCYLFDTQTLSEVAGTRLTSSTPIADPEDATLIQSAAFTPSAGTRTYRVKYGGPIPGSYKCHMAQIRVRNP